MEKIITSNQERHTPMKLMTLTGAMIALCLNSYGDQITLSTNYVGIGIEADPAGLLPNPSPILPRLSTVIQFGPGLKVSTNKLGMIQIDLAPTQNFLFPSNPPASVNLGWTPSISPAVTGYWIYYGVGPRQYTNKLAVGSVTNATIPGLTRGVTYYFGATATDGSGLESVFSNEVTNTPALPPEPPGLSVIDNKDGTISIVATGAPHQAFSLLASNQLQEWMPLTGGWADDNGVMRFAISTKDRPYRFFRVTQ